MQPIAQVAENWGLPEMNWNFMAIISQGVLISIEDNQDKPDGKLILVTAINPTWSGEGKPPPTWASMALNYIGKKPLPP